MIKIWSLTSHYRRRVDYSNVHVCVFSLPIPCVLLFLCLLHNIMILTGCPWSEMPQSYNNWPCLEEDSVVQTGIFDLGHTVLLVFFTVLAFLFLLSWVLLILCLFLFVLFVNRLTTPWAIRGRGFILCL